jgi:ABC-type sugar transport system permease subunit
MSESTIRGRTAALAAERRQSYQWRLARSGVLMTLPALLVVAIFTLYPFWYALNESVHLSSPILGRRFTGLENYRAVLTSPYFLDAARTTLIFAAIAVPLLVVLGVLVALLLNERFPGNTVLRAGMLLPWAIPASVVGVIWKWVFLDSWGALNAGLYSLGLIDGYISWLTTPWLARLAVVVAFTWSQLPLVSILLLAALQAIPDELYEAAAIDGASAVTRFLAVTLPGIRPMLVIVTLYQILMALNVFDITYAMTGGGPGTATSLLTYYIWAETFKMLNFGNGAALAVLIALIALAFIVLILRALPKDALLGERT